VLGSGPFKVDVDSEANPIYEEYKRLGLLRTKERIPDANPD
jgi:hypothetical protein